jgi:Ca-activated chloride channel family protein
MNASLFFAHPEWLWAALLLPSVLLLLFVRNQRRIRPLLLQMVASRLQKRLLHAPNPGQRWTHFLLLLSGTAMAAIALAQPQLGEDWLEVTRSGRDILIAVDTSKSMLATDLAPDRLTRAKMAARDLITRLPGDRIGLVAFSGTAFLQAPLTIDHDAVLHSLEELDTEIVPQGGTNLAAAIRMAKEAFGKGEGESRALIFFTDGEDLEADGLSTASDSKDQFRIFTVGLGSPDGSLIPLKGGRGSEFLKDSNGQIVKSRLDEEGLSKIAAATGGFYTRLDRGQAVAEHLVKNGLAHIKAEQFDAKTSRRPIERFEWPLGCALFLVAAAFLLGDSRRSPQKPLYTAQKSRLPESPLAGTALLALLFFGSENGVFAKNQAIEAYERQDFKGAADSFRKQLERQPGSLPLHFNLGTAAYQSGDYEVALQEFSQSSTSEDPNLRQLSEYNLGNTLYQRGASQQKPEDKLAEWKNAVQHYEQSLQIAPKDTRTQRNLGTVQKLIEELEKQQKEQNKQDGKQESDSSKDQKDSDQPQDSDSSKGSSEENKDEKSDSGKEDQKSQKEDKPGEESKNPSSKSPPEEGDVQNQKNQQKPEGDLRNQPQFGEDQKTKDAKEEADDAQAAAEGKMTPQQAKSLLESLRSEDQRVQLIEKNRIPKGRTLRDW